MEYGLAVRISVVTETYAPEINGVAMTLGRLTEGLRDRGHAVEVIRPRHPGLAAEAQCASELHVAGCPIPGYPGLRFGLPAWRRLRRRWRDARPDVVYVATEGPLGMAAVLTARGLRIPISSGFHTRFDHYCRHYRLGWLEGPIRGYLKTLHNQTASTLVPTAAMQARLASQGFRNVQILSRGVDTQLFHPDRRSMALRESWGLGDDGLAVLHVGRLASEKNLPLTLAAFAAIRQVRQDVRLVLVGDGPMSVVLKGRHPEHLFAGSRSGVDLARHYASADLFLFPSLSETFGNVTLEAMASGLPVVAFAEAAAAELIRDDENGVLVEPGDTEAFVRGALRLAQGAEARQAMARQARLSATSRDWATVVLHFEALLGAAAGMPYDQAALGTREA